MADYREYCVQYRHIADTDADLPEDRCENAPSLATAQSRARRLSQRHHYAVASVYRRLVDDEHAPLTLMTEWVYTDGRLDFRNDLEAA